MKSTGLVFSSRRYLGNTPPPTTTLEDTSRYGNNGTISGDTWTKLPSGLWVLSFDGSNDYVQFSSANINFKNTYWISVWAKSTNLTGERYILGTANMSEAGDFYIRQNDGTGIIQFGELSKYRAFGSAIAVNTPFKIDVVSNGSQIFLYQNGVPTEGLNVDTNGVNWDEIVYIGKGYRNLTWSGDILPLNIYNRDPSAQEISDIFESERGLFGV